MVASPQVVSNSRAPFNGSVEPIYRRGDVSVNGAVQINDAILVLRFLFGEGTHLQCEKAADANDDGNLNVTDAIAILEHLFNGAGPLSEPFERCGADPTVDSLACDEILSCRS